MNTQEKKAAAFTGYRTTKLPFYPTKENVLHLKNKLKEAIRTAYEDGIRFFYSGMCQGVDIWAALSVLELKEELTDIELICAVPFEGHTDSLKDIELYEYEYIISHAYRTDCLKGRISHRELARAFNERNYYMVSNADLLIAVCNKDSISPGGTANTVKMAKKKGINIMYIDPSEIEITK